MLDPLTNGQILSQTNPGAITIVEMAKVAYFLNEPTSHLKQSFAIFNTIGVPIAPGKMIYHIPDTTKPSLSAQHSIDAFNFKK